MFGNIQELEALNKLINGDQDSEDWTIHQNPTLGQSALTPGDIGGTSKKELAPPNTQISVKGNRNEKNTIWKEEEILNSQLNQSAALSETRKQPDYEIIPRQKVGTQDVYLGMSDLDPSSVKCQEILVKVKLPDTEMKEITLDVQQQHINLQAPKWVLDLPLPKKVLFKNGKAQWDKKTSSLHIILPVDPQDIAL